MRPALALTLAASLVTACATAPTPTAASRAIRANPRATVLGRVRDPQGRPAAGIAVRGIPRGADIPWSPWAKTECDGTFRLTLFAPGGYTFLLGWKDVAVETDDPRDPAMTLIDVEPGQTVSGVELLFLLSEWQRISESAPADTPSCR